MLKVAEIRIESGARKKESLPVVPELPVIARHLALTGGGLRRLIALLGLRSENLGFRAGDDIG